MTVERIIHIGPIPYTLKFVASWARDSGSCTTFGEVIYSEAIIILRRGQTPEQMRSSLWHEMLHAIMRQAGIGDIPRSEQIVEALSYGITDVLDRNAALSKDGLDALYFMLENPDGEGLVQL